MKRLGTILIALFVLIAGLVYIKSLDNSKKPIPAKEPSQNLLSEVVVVAEGLDTPWGITFLPDKSMLVTERPGRVRLINGAGKLDPNPVKTITNVKEIGEGGLLGITIHPDFSFNNFVYLYYTYSSNGDNTLNRVVRMTYQDKQLKDEQIIADNIPGASNHNGGRIKFGPDGFLYITTGDAQNPSQSQDKNSLAGKILRVTDEGKPATGNPFNNLVYSFGHRNPQGIAWDKSGQLWETEHGQSAMDELNKIEIGKNYGWPVIRGNEKRDGMVSPVIHSGNETWAPSGLAFVNSSFYFGGLRGQTLFKVGIVGGVPQLTKNFEGKFGRIRDVIVSPDGFLYITTSNHDGRGIPTPSDDRVIKIDPSLL